MLYPHLGPPFRVLQSPPTPLDTTPMNIPNCELYNVVILPTSDPDIEPRSYQLSATRIDRDFRFVSPDWPMARVRSALLGADVSAGALEELLRGNNIALSGRTQKKCLLTEQQLLDMGLTLFTPEPA